MNVLSKADLATAIGTLTGKTATLAPIVNKDVSSLSFTTNKVYFGVVRLQKTDPKYKAQFVPKYGTLVGNQAAVQTINLKDESGLCEGILFSSTTSVKCAAILEGYEITLS